MGDIADMMIGGAMCQSCGEYLGEGDGYPTFCASCAREQGIDLNDPYTEKPVKLACPECGRRVKGLADHRRDKHGIKP